MEWTTYERKSTATLKEKLQARVEEAKDRLESIRQEIAELRAEDRIAIDHKARMVRQRIDAQRVRAEGLREEAASWLHDKDEAGEALVQSWRDKRAARRLERRAERAEEFAINALVNAMIDADAAELAILEAFEARLDAEAAGA